MTFLRRLIAFCVVVALLATPAIVFLKKQEIYDWWRLQSYEPTPQVASLATNTTMNPLGRKLFYVYAPAVQEKDLFRRSCNDSEQSIVLGCYKANDGIYILNVQDERLSGIKEVTAAHEMLHAAYDRLSRAERNHVDEMVSAAAAQLTDERIKKTIEQYRAKDPNVVPNELHSILGTEVRDLPAELESYYAKYFTDRKRIVAYSEQYEAEFSERKEKIDDYDNELVGLKKQIESLETSLASDSKTLESDRKELEALYSSGNRAEYNSRVQDFNAKVRSYNSQVKQAQTLIAEYNALVAKRNAIASEERSLVQVIDTRITTQQTE